MDLVVFHSPDRLDRKLALEQEAQSGLQYPQTFCHSVAEGLDRLSFEERQELLRLVVDRVTVKNGTVSIETVIPNSTDGGQLRTRRGDDLCAITQLRFTLERPLARSTL